MSRAPRSTFLPFSPPLLGDEEVDEVLDTLRGSWITTGPKTKLFEREFAEFVSSPDAVAVSSCTDALQVALAAIGVGPGDAVFTTTMTFCSTVHVIEHVGARPILVDVQPDTLNLDPAALRVAVEAVAAAGELVPRCIIPVHFGGNPCDMTSIDALAAEYGMAIVEDAAHAVPASIGGRMIGDPTAPVGVIRATAFSFYATKNLTTGEGGMLTAPPDVLDEARLWSLHGMSRDAWKRYGEAGSWFYEVVRPGFKCNMTDIQAALGLHQLRRLPSFQERRRQAVATYAEAFAGHPEVECPKESAGATSAWHLFPLRLNLEALTIDRSAFIDEMTRRNIGTSVHFIPVHLHPYYRDRYGFEAEQFPVAWHEYHRLVSLPLNPSLTDGDLEDIVTAVIDVIEKHRK
jgi:dTDP-4-amino-4,6-dideoxygalactose transaminase